MPLQRQTSVKSRSLVGCQKWWTDQTQLLAWIPAGPRTPARNPACRLIKTDPRLFLR